MIKQAKLDAQRQEEELIQQQEENEEDGEIEQLSRSIMSAKSEKSTSSQGSKLFMTQKRPEVGNFKKKNSP